MTAFDCRVLHVLPPGGGGVDRHVRTLLSQRLGDLLVHTCGDQVVLERPGAVMAGNDGPDASIGRTAHFHVLAAGDLAAHARRGAFGAPLVLHAHGTVPSVRATVELLGQATGVPYLLTLHDIWFADPEQPDDERAARLAFARGAAQVLAPSAFIVERAAVALGPNVSCQLLPVGDPPYPLPQPIALSPAAQAARGGEHGEGLPIAVIGAIGAHKGRSALDGVVALLPPDVRAMVLGYTEFQLRPGHTLSGRLWVHGLFEPRELPSLAAAYGVRLAFFPPGMPESHCYALTDAWMSGLPVLAPDHGAIAERVRRHGGGTLYAPDLPLPALTDLLLRTLQSAQRHPGPLPLARPLPTLQEMMATMNPLYADAAAGQAPDGPVAAEDDAAAHLPRQHLDGRFFRLEILHLQREVEERLAESEALRHALAAAQAERDQAARALEQAQQRLSDLRARAQRVLGWLPAAWRRRLLGGS